MRKATKKTNKIGDWRKMSLDTMVEYVAQNGDRFGSDIIEMMDLKELDPVTLGTITIGLSKAWAMVKDLGRRTGIDVETLHKKETASYRRLFEKLNDE